MRNLKLAENQEEQQAQQWVDRRYFETDAQRSDREFLRRAVSRAENAAKEESAIRALSSSKITESDLANQEFYLALLVLAGMTVLAIDPAPFCSFTFFSFFLVLCALPVAFTAMRVRKLRSLERVWRDCEQAYDELLGAFKNLKRVTRVFEGGAEYHFHNAKKRDGYMYFVVNQLGEYTHERIKLAREYLREGTESGSLTKVIELLSEPIEVRQTVIEQDPSLVIPLADMPIVVQFLSEKLLREYSAELPDFTPANRGKRLTTFTVIEREALVS